MTAPPDQPFVIVSTPYALADTRYASDPPDADFLVMLKEKARAEHEQKIAIYDPDAVWGVCHSDGRPEGAAGSWYSIIGPVVMRRP